MKGRARVLPSDDPAADDPAADDTPAVDLSSYRNPPGHDKGAGLFKRSVWHLVNAAFLLNPVNPSSRLKVALIRLFGGKVGAGVVLKPGINVKHPWFLTVGDHTWIGEGVWLDNTFAPITLGSHVCVSQGAYLCTGNHDWSDPAFGLMERPLTVEDGAWIGARAAVLPGARIASHTVLTGGSVIARATEAYTVYAGNPAVPVRRRVVRPGGGAGRDAAA